MTSTDATPSDDMPAYLLMLEAVFGGPSQNGFGSAVFFIPGPQDVALEETARSCYQHFVGENWEKWGAEAWLGPWRETYRRDHATKHDIIAELRDIQDPESRLQVRTLLDTIDDTAEAFTALAAAYNDPEMIDLQVYNLGDGDAMTGVLIAGSRKNSDVTILAFLLD